MRPLLCFFTALAWGLWLGGLITLFILVSNLFAVDRSAALVAAPRMFLAFERYQVVVAAALLIGSAIWRLREQRALLTALFFTVAVTSAGCVLSTAIITPRMETLRQQGQSSSPQFKALHGRSMMVYTSEAALLFIVGIILTMAMTSPPREIAPEAAEASAPPASPADRPPSPKEGHPISSPPPRAPA